MLASWSCPKARLGWIRSSECSSGQPDYEEAQRHGCAQRPDRRLEGGPRPATRRTGDGPGGARGGAGRRSPAWTESVDWTRKGRIFRRGLLLSSPRGGLPYSVFGFIYTRRYCTVLPCQRGCVMTARCLNEPLGVRTRLWGAHQSIEHPHSWVR